MTNKSISPLRRRMIEDMTVRNLSPTTRKSYIQNVKKLPAGIIVPTRPLTAAARGGLGSAT